MLISIGGKEPSAITFPVFIFELGKYTHRPTELLGLHSVSTVSACAGARMLVGGLRVVADLRARLAN